MLFIGFPDSWLKTLNWWMAHRLKQNTCAPVIELFTLSHARMQLSLSGTVLSNSLAPFSSLNDSVSDYWAISIFTPSFALLPPSSLCSGKSQFQSSQSQPPRLNERNGRILGYYIRYGQLGSETLSKKTIRDTENLQVGNSTNCHLFLYLAP